MQHTMIIKCSYMDMKIKHSKSQKRVYIYSKNGEDNQPDDRHFAFRVSYVTGNGVY